MPLFCKTSSNFKSSNFKFNLFKIKFKVNHQNQIIMIMDIGPNQMSVIMTLLIECKMLVSQTTLVFPSNIASSVS